MSHHTQMEGEVCTPRMNKLEQPSDEGGRPMLRRLVHAINDQRAQRIAGILSKHISQNDRVLDCGCGTMRVAHFLRETMGAKPLGIDITHLNETNLESCVGDAARLPFADQSFDVVYAAFILHHTFSGNDIIAECLRVAHKRVIFLEDVYSNGIELQVLKILDWLGNKAISDEIPLPFTFRPEADWIELFQDLGASVGHVEHIRPFTWLPSRHRMFVLERKGFTHSK